MEFLSEYGLFLAKAVTIVVCVFIIVSIVMSLNQKTGKGEKGHIEVTNLNDRYEAMNHAVAHVVLDPLESKQKQREEKKKTKKEHAERKKALKVAAKKNKQSQSSNTASTTENVEDKKDEHKKRVFVLDYHGDMKASATQNLREEITAVLSIASQQDEVVVRLESAGGMVHSYGLASSQLQRIKNKNIPLTICVDKVAASGGYMMACVANKILAAPFAILGSIGVVGQLPNFHRLLQKIPVDYEMQTAGEYKRTLTMFAENTDKARQKFSQELEETHDLFKSFIYDNRPELDVATVATGETWYGSRALEKKLVDNIQTSDEYLLDQIADADVLEVQYVLKKSLSERVGLSMQAAMDRLILTWIERLQSSKFFS